MVDLFFGELFGKYFVIYFIPVLVFRIVATVRISAHGGSGVGFFLFGWLYIACSAKAREWKFFDKTTAVILGICFNALLSFYVLAKLEIDDRVILEYKNQEDDTMIQADVAASDYTPRYCKYCGAKLSGSGNYCWACGKKQDMR
jgi:hypothetical protein